MNVNPRGDILTITLNPALDLTAGLDTLRPGAVNRIATAQMDPGGKGVNVAGFLAPWGLRMAVSGFLGDDNRQAFERMFKTAGIADHFVPVPGSTRTNIKIVEGDGERITDLNFPGFTVTPEDQAALLATVEREAAAHDWVLFCGSLPQGAGPDLYPHLIAAAKAAGARVGLDTSGPALATAVAAGPTVIKPNGEELGEILGRPIETVADAVIAAGEMRGRGIETVIVSLGADGAVFAGSDRIVHARGIARRIQSTVGAGDALLAGFTLASVRGLDLAEAARLATGFSLGALSMLGPRLPPSAEVVALAKTVQVQDINP